MRSRGRRRARPLSLVVTTLLLLVALVAAAAVTSGGAVRATATPSSSAGDPGATPGGEDDPALAPTPPSCVPFENCRECRSQLNCKWCDHGSDGPCVQASGTCPNGKEPLLLDCGTFDCSAVYECGDRGECVQVNTCNCRPEFKSDPDVGCAFCEECLPPDVNVPALVGGLVGGLVCIAVVVLVAIVVFFVASKKLGGDDTKAAGAAGAAAAGTQMQDPYAQGSYGYNGQMQDGTWTGQDPNAAATGAYYGDGTAAGYDGSTYAGGTYAGGTYTGADASAYGGYANNQYGDAAGGTVDSSQYDRAGAYGAGGGAGGGYGATPQYGDGSAAYQQGGTGQWG